MSEFKIGDKVKVRNCKGVIRYIEGGELAVLVDGYGLQIVDESEISSAMTNYDMLLNIANKHTLRDGYPLTPQQTHVVNHLYNLGLFDKDAIERFYDDQMAD